MLPFHHLNQCFSNCDPRSFARPWILGIKTTLNWLDFSKQNCYIFFIIISHVNETKLHFYSIISCTVLTASDIDSFKYLYTLRDTLLSNIITRNKSASVECNFSTYAVHLFRSFSRKSICINSLNWEWYGSTNKSYVDSVE